MLRDDLLDDTVSPTSLEELPKQRYNRTISLACVSRPTSFIIYDLLMKLHIQVNMGYSFDFSWRICRRPEIKYPLDGAATILWLSGVYLLGTGTSQTF